MDTRLQNQAKAPSPSSVGPVQTGLFQSRPFTEPEQEATEALDSSHQPPDLQTQLDRASRLGHNFSQVQVQSHTPAVIQQQPVSEQLEEQQDEQESDWLEPMKMMAPPIGNPIQRETFEEAPMQMMPQLGWLPPRIQRESEEEEPIQMMPQLGLLTPRMQRESEEEEPIQMMPQLGWLQRLPQDEDEEPIQMMPQLGLIQRQEPDVDEEPIQTKRIQLKVVVGQPGDKYEQEADSVAAQVMSMSAPPANSAPIQRQEEEEQEPLVQRSSLADSITPLVQRLPEEQEEPLQAKSLLQRAGNGNTDAGSNVESQLNSSKGGGSPLPDEVRSFMEPRFGADFSSVRVHTDSSAVQMNKDLGAQAFTHGSDIYYGSGKSPAKDDLTAHELTHTIQQTGRVQPKSYSELLSRSDISGKQLKASPNHKDSLPPTVSGNALSLSQTSIQRLCSECTKTLNQETDETDQQIQAKELSDHNFLATSNRLPYSSLKATSGTTLLQAKEVCTEPTPSESKFKINHDLISLPSNTHSTIQRQVATHQNPETARAANARVKQEMNQALQQNQASSKPRSPDASTSTSANQAATGSQANGSTRQIDRTQVEEKKSELLSKAQPDSGRSPHETQVEQTAAKVVEEANKPSKSLTDSKEITSAGEPKAGKGDDSAVGSAEQAANLANQAFSMADTQSVPDTPVEVVTAQPVTPMDAQGKLLPADPEGDSQISNLTGKVQVLREQGHSLRQQAAQERSNAEIIRGNIKVAEAGIQQAEAGIEKSQSHLAYRREVVGQAKSALTTSEQKANMVAEQAPTYTAKANEGKAQSEPMAGEAGQLAAENASKTPADAEASAKSQEQGQKLNKVNADIRSTDDAITQTKAKAESLSQEAGEAKQTNAQTKAKISTMEATLAQTENKFSQMNQQNVAGRAQLAGVKQGPAQMMASATALDQQGESLVQASVDLESRIHQSQQNFEKGMNSVPGSTLNQNQGGTGNTTFVQRTAEGRYEDRANLNWGGKLTDELPPWLTGEERASEEARRAAQQQEQARRQNEINEIDKQAGGHFEQLSAADKSAIALRLTGRHLFASVRETQWPKFLGHMAQGLVDPRISLMGVVQGLSMTFSGAANLVSGEQWSRDPLGNLLKSSADIATGITIVLGSIAALALAIAIILSAIAIIGFLFTGGATAALTPIISFCGTVASTVGGWTIAAAKVALVLQALVFIKNLIDAATATSAKDLQNQADQMTEDTKNAGNMAMQIGMAKVAEVGGKALGETAIGQRMASGAQSFGEQVGIVKPSATPVAEGAPIVGEGTASAAPEGTLTPPEATSVKAPPEGTAPPPEGAPSTKAPPEGATSAAEGTPAKGTPEGAPVEEPVPPREAGAPSELETPNGKRSTHLDEPVVEEGIVAKEKTADGQHEVKVTQDGRVVRCSTCAELRVEIEQLPDSHPQKQALQERLNQIEANPDPQAKAAQAKELEADIHKAKQIEGEAPPQEGEPLVQETPNAKLENRIKNLKERAYRALERAEKLPNADPNKYPLKGEAEALREQLKGLENDVHGAPEDVHEILESYANDAERDLVNLEQQLPELEGSLPEGAHTKLSQEGGLMATEGYQVENPPGELGQPAHPLKEHGPNTDPNWLKKMAQESRSGAAAKFTDRAVMETAIGETIDAHQVEISSWLGENPSAGTTKAFDFDPGLGNLGEGFYTAADRSIQPIPTDTMPLTKVRVVLKATGQSSPGQRPYIIQSAFPMSPTW